MAWRGSKASLILAITVDESDISHPRPIAPVKLRASKDT
jgi:hypothetical protein